MIMPQLLLSSHLDTPKNVQPIARAALRKGKAWGSLFLMG
jgi:hypothetical protein